MTDEPSIKYLIFAQRKDVSVVYSVWKADIKISEKESITTITYQLLHQILFLKNLHSCLQLQVSKKGKKMLKYINKKKYERLKGKVEREVVFTHYQVTKSVFLVEFCSRSDFVQYILWTYRYLPSSKSVSLGKRVQFILYRCNASLKNIKGQYEILCLR